MSSIFYTEEEFAALSANAPLLMIVRAACTEFPERRVHVITEVYRKAKELGAIEAPSNQILCFAVIRELVRNELKSPF